MEIREYMDRDPSIAAILHELPEELLSTIRIRRYQPGDVVIQRCEDPESTATYIILEGVCCSTCNFKNGEQVWFRKATVHDVFGLYGNFKSRHTYCDFSATIFAKTPSVLAMIPQSTVRLCFSRYVDFTNELTGRTLARLNDGLWRLSECNNYPPYAGVITYLIYAYEFYRRCYPLDYDGAVKIPEKRTEIANFMCINVRTLQRILPQLKAEDLILIQSGSIYIDPPRYEALKERQEQCFY
ncbi:Crp/Fnr family transcriptional regulator [Oscillibacter sp. MSJ-2]|uniref:Crp/Fnr family transcriptional regulator n=1 Tax=Dysosmobacter acutus TaxID=2841504 RepID=A0ABS6F7L1_9FIRM|nr:Crp/Fnr family transcriptional regulator [Dysosmobacter acutus]